MNGEEVLRDEVGRLRAMWEETSFQLERLQANPSYVSQEEAGLIRREGPKYQLTFNPSEKPPLLAEVGMCMGTKRPIYLDSALSTCAVYLHRFHPAEGGCCA